MSYNDVYDEVEGLGEFGDVGKYNYFASQSVIFMLRDLVCKWKQSIGYLLTSITPNPDFLKSFF